MFKITATHVPPPLGMPSPLLWGDEVAVRDRLRVEIADLQLTRRWISFNYPFDPLRVVECLRLYYGPTLRAFEALDAVDQAALRRDLERLWSEHNQAADGTTHVESEYLEVVAIRN
jgi:hypothetical protein